MNNITKNHAISVPIKRIYIALAGCGKSTRLVSDAIAALKDNRKILYLSYNKKIRHEVIQNNGLPKSCVHTFHSLAYSDIIRSNFFNKIFPDYTHSQLSKYFEDTAYSDSVKLTKAALNNLINWWCKYADDSAYKDIDYIFVDEFQDVESSMLLMLQTLYNLNEQKVQIIAAGDPYQTIYNFNNFEDSNLFFDRCLTRSDSSEIVFLNINYRNSPSIQRFVNKFYERHYTDGRFYDLSDYTDKDFTSDVIIHCVQHHRDIDRVIDDIVKSYPCKEITILGRVNSELERFKNIDNRIRVSTIHADKGNSCDICIIVNMIFNDKIDSIEDKNIWNVAITRPREKLYIITSFPRGIVLSKFGEGTYTLVDEQKPLSVSNVTDIIDEPVFLTYEKVKRSVIDSIELQLDYDKASFIPYEKQNLKKQSPFQTDTSIIIKNVRFVLHRLGKKFNKKLVFDFHDLSKFKNQGFNDLQIVEYIEDMQKEYFNRNCYDSDIDQQKLKRLDLALYFKVPSYDILNTLLLFFKLSRSANSRKNSVLISNDIGSSSLYLNSYFTKKHSRIRRFRGIRAYFPRNKNNDYRLHDADCVMKIELYRIMESGRNNRGSLDLTLKELKDVISSDSLNRLFYEWLYFEFPYLKEKPVKNIKLIQKRLNISTLDDAVRMIEKGHLTIREKRNLFFILSDLIDIDEAEAVKQIFGIT